MNMQVRYGLACCGAVIDANVVTVGLKALIQFCLRRVQHCQKARAFLARCFEERLHVAAGEDQSVAF